MNTMFLHAHRGFAYLELLLVAFFLVALFLVMFGYSGKTTSFLRKMSLFTMIIFHIQLIVGLGLLILVSPLSTIIAIPPHGPIRLGLQRAIVLRRRVLQKAATQPNFFKELTTDLLSRPTQ